MIVMARVLLLLVLGVAATSARRVEYEELKVVFSWKQLDFRYPTVEDKQKAIDAREFVPENNIPIGIEVWKDKIFMTVPRYKTGVPASLAYIKKSDRHDAPLLRPYPDWASHNLSHLTEGRIVSPFRLSVDSCDRLWVIDTGTNDFMGNITRLSLPQVMVYNLLTDKLLRNYTLPADQAPEKSFFANIAVDVVDCNSTWAYLSDLGANGLVVYDWAKNTSWRISHDSFKSDPIARNFTVGGLNFQFPDGLFGMALSKLNPVTKDRTMYYHPFASYHEYQVPANILRSEEMTRAGLNADKFVDLGSKGPNTQASSSVFDEDSGILLYAQPNFNAIGCWNTQKVFSQSTLGMFGANNVTMIYPNDLKVGSRGRLWAISNKMPVWRLTGLNSTDVNFRLHTGTVRKLTALTRCAVAGGSRRNHGPSIPLIIVAPIGLGQGIGQGLGNTFSRKRFKGKG